MHDPILKRWQFAVGGSLVLAGLGLIVAGCLARLSLSDLRGLPGRKTFVPATMG